jgi:hypothetical protein
MLERLSKDTSVSGNWLTQEDFNILNYLKLGRARRKKIAHNTGLERDVVKVHLKQLIADGLVRKTCQGYTLAENIILGPSYLVRITDEVVYISLFGTYRLSNEFRGMNLELIASTISWIESSYND